MQIRAPNIDLRCNGVPNQARRFLIEARPFKHLLLMSHKCLLQGHRCSVSSKEQIDG
jgi:hypothetical protein